ncbi:hypothetical protein [Halocatena marina]|uniref:Uncharacterized protein n=1 Tax=Halocatena marina TaxID=2934937 RepID=A0ABD5YJF6_9EURY|nr:hypothetical protein [Halocatena marina]
MIWNDTPYVYDRFDDSEISDEPVQISESDEEVRETVITDGVAMSYRSYQRRKPGK